MRTFAHLQPGETVQVKSGETVRIQDFTLKLSSSGRDHIAWADVKPTSNPCRGALIAPIERVFHSKQKDRVYRGAQQSIDEEFIVGNIAVNVCGAGRSHCIRVKIDH